MGKTSFTETEEYRALISKLTEAATRFRSGDNPAEKRLAIADIIIAVMELVRSDPDDADVGVLAPLHDLLGALGDLNDGVQPRLLRKSDLGSARRKDNVYQRDMGAMSAMVDLLVNTGESEKAAARRVVRKAKKIGIGLPDQTQNSQTQPWESLLNYRGRLRSAKEDDPKFAQAHSVYRTWRELHGQICAEDKLHPDKAAEIVFEIGWPELMGQ